MRGRASASRRLMPSARSTGLGAPCRPVLRRPEAPCRARASPTPGAISAACAASGSVLHHHSLADNTGNRAGGSRRTVLQSSLMAELPRGAVTFLFTDIEGSTQLVKQLRERYGEVLGEHQRLLRESFAKHGGYEIDTQGDAFFIAFASARDAVLAAVEAQRAVSRYPWPDGAPLRVRMGIHTGQASPVDGRYTGLAVHRAARICAAGHGGLVPVSQATQTLLEDEEEDLAVGLH